MRSLLPVLACLTVAAPQSAPWNQWRHSRPIELLDTNAPRMVRVTLPLEVYPHAQPQLSDLRVVDDTGREVPYLVHTKPRVAQRVWRATRLEDLGYVAGKHTHAILDLRESAELHNTLVLDTGEADFFAWVDVDTSDDRRDWRSVRTRVPVYRFRREGLEGNQVISYPQSRARYLRLRILPQEDRLFQLSGARVAHEIVEEAELVQLPVQAALDSAAPEAQTCWRFDFGGGNVPVSEVRFETPAAAFHRPVHVSASRDGHQWNVVGSGTIYRLTREDAPLEVLRVDFGEVMAPYLRVAVYNRNDPPIEALTVAMYGTPRHMVFTQTPGRRYRLLYGTSAAPRPEYELAHLVQVKDLEGAIPLQLGAEETRTDWTDPRPWTERHPVILWAALAVAVVVMGGLALRSLRRAV